LRKKVSEVPASLDYDAFGRIYEYFLGEFARTEEQGAANSIHRRQSFASLWRSSNHTTGACSILRADQAACSSSARFIAEHKKNPAAELSIRGVEKRMKRVVFAE
jgi:type I restriction enzyme M protein